MPPVKNKKGSFAELSERITKNFGENTAVFGGLQKACRSIPTGSLALDYELGTGGWPMGSISTVYGPRDIGKSSIVLLNGIRNAQAMGLNCVWIAVEPVGDAEWRSWVEAAGVNVDDLLVLYPGPETPGEDAMAMLIECAKTPDVGFIGFDSLGGLLSESEVAEDGKPRMGGQAGLITWALKASVSHIYHNDIAVVLINQVRDDLNSKYGGFKMPGGHALEHFSQIIVHLRPGKDKYTIKSQGTDIIAGRQIIAHIQRNKKTMGTGHKAIFDYYSMEIPGHPIGIDTFTDIINTGKRTGVIKQAGKFYTMPNDKRLEGWDNVVRYLEAQPEVVTMVRDGVLEAMLKRIAKTELEEVSDG